MFKFFKERSEIKKKAYDEGLAEGRRLCNKKLRRWKKDVQAVFKEKNRKIRDGNKRVLDIEREFEKYSLIFSKARFVALRIEKESELKLQESTSEYNVKQTISNELLFLDREYHKKLPSTVKKIEKFKEEELLQ